MISIVISGRCPSKKNSRMIVCRGKFPMNMPSAKYKEWHKVASLQLVQQKIQPVKGCVKEMVATFYAPDNRKYDLSNKFESIADLLVDNGVLEDDNYTILPRVVMIFGGVDRENPRIEVLLTID